MRLIPVLTLLSLLPAGAAPQSDTDTAEIRPALLALEQALDRAVSVAAPPSPIAMLAGPRGSHGYHLKGQGAFFVLPARRLPVRRPHVLMIQGAPGFELSGPEGAELVERVTAIHQEADRVNREAEQAYRRVRREIHVRFRGTTDPEAVAPDPDAEDAAPPGWREQAIPPPWHFWFEADEMEPAPVEGADELVADVRAALTSVLESDAALLPILGPDEFLAVAVDFVSDPFFASGGQRPRTLVLRANRRDIEARHSGRLSPQEFREKIVYEEY